uniref:3-hydroxyacyl-CoA dehydrogenase, NAD-binding protein n=1 Tax=Rhodopseudomonas palustris (strain BisA53) TaxID=316055 RepID=Q07LM4_RHOP5
MTMTLQNPLLHQPTRAFPKSIAIIGAGTIGPDIGYYLKSAIDDLTLHLVDVSQEALDRARQRFEGYARKAVERGRMKQVQADRVCANLHTTLSYDDIASVDWALEAATEDVALKHRIFAQLESLLRPDAIITSNTSSLPAETIFAKLKDKRRATVTHFFAPAWRNPIVEVIDWKQADPNLVKDLCWFFCATGKTPLITADAPCFMLDRIFDNWCNEAALMLQTATAAQIDTVAGEFVHAGPFFVLNMANGNPIIVETNTLQANTEGAHYTPAEIFNSVDRWKTVAPGKRVDVPASAAAAVRDRLIGILASQSCDILDRNIGSAADLELGCRLALGFKQGPLDLLKSLGEAETTRIVARMKTERPDMPLPTRPVDAYQDFLRHLLVDDVGGVKVITIRRPEAMNALHDELTDEILSVLRAHEQDATTRGFVIVGYGLRAFCAGADIGRFPRMLGKADEAAQYARDCSRLLTYLDRMDKPVIAAVNGLALGGGLELALRCHAIVASSTASMQFPEITLGIVPGIGAMVVPFRRWPAASETFAAMLRQARKLDAATAHRLGVVDTLAKDYAELVATAVARVEALAGSPRDNYDAPVALPELAAVEHRADNGQVLSRAIVAIMDQAIIDAAAATSFEAALEIGYRAFGASACAAAAHEGIASFLERRAPDFSKTG